MPGFDFYEDRVVFDSGDGLEMLVEDGNFFLNHFRKAEELDNVGIFDPRDQQYWIFFRGFSGVKEWITLEKIARTHGRVTEINEPPPEVVEHFKQRASRN